LVDLVFLVLALFDSSLLSSHFWPFTDVLRKFFGSLTRKLYFEQPAFAEATAGRQRMSRMQPMGSNELRRANVPLH
jgi:hypothetical protein